MANLANKYRPKTFDELTEQSIIVEILKSICNQPQLEIRNFLFIGPAGCGKAQPLNSKVLTPHGFINMGDVSIGDEVFTSCGNIGKISGIYPQGTRPIYEIKLQDHTTIRVSDEHLNLVYRYNEDQKIRQDYCLTTTELIKLFETSRFKLRVDTPEVDWPEADLPIDPYLLGALLGDGSLSNNFGFSNSESDVISKVDNILRRDWDLYLSKVEGDNVDYNISCIHDSSYKYRYYYKSNIYTSLTQFQQQLVADGYAPFDIEAIRRMCDDPDHSGLLRKYPELRSIIRYEVNPYYHHADKLKRALKELGVCTTSVTKHIPSQYLYANKSQRIELLQGLYDTDGYTDTQGNAQFTTCSAQLSDDFAFLVRSLGVRDTVSASPCRYTAKDATEPRYTGSTAYSHSLKFPKGFIYYSSEKHGSRYTIHQNDPIRNIVSITYVGEEPCQCIMVDHPDHTYISDGFIPTHNTTLARCVANILNSGSGEPLEIDAASHNGVDSVREIIQQASTYPVGAKYKVFILDEVHAFSQQAWQMLLKTLEEGPAKSIFVLCTTNPEKIPATILSRVQTFQLSKISLGGITDRLIHVIECENREGRNITYNRDAVSFIAKMAQGGMRDALTLLDKALSYSTDITSENLMKALNLPEYNDYFALLSAYAKKDNVAITRIVNDVYNSGVNFIKWFEGFHSFVMNVVKYIFLQDIEATMIPSHYLDKISKYSTAHSIICLRLANKLLKLTADLKTTQYLQEVALTYLCSIPKKGE